MFLSKCGHPRSVYVAQRSWIHILSEVRRNSSLVSNVGTRHHLVNMRLASTCSASSCLTEDSTVVLPPAIHHCSIFTARHSTDEIKVLQLSVWLSINTPCVRSYESDTLRSSNRFARFRQTGQHNGSTAWPHLLSCSTLMFRLFNLDSENRSA